MSVTPLTRRFTHGLLTALLLGALLPAFATAQSSPQAATAQAVDQDALYKRYIWLKNTEGLGQLTTLAARFPAPRGFEREAAAPNSYQDYLRGLPLRTDRTDVLRFDGAPVSMPSAAIIPLDLGKRDLHQCADSVIRLYAEHLWSIGKAEEARFHYTSGDLAAWKDWRSGKVLRVKGSKVEQVKTKAAPNTYQAYRSWQDQVFMYASTRSMSRDSARVTASSELRAGDFFLQSGSPGHVVVLLDIARAPDGRRAALIGQGFLPAREVHVISGQGARVLDGVWYLLPDASHPELDTPTWRPFSMKDAWRFKF